MDDKSATPHHLAVQIVEDVVTEYTEYGEGAAERIVKALTDAGYGLHAPEASRTEERFKNAADTIEALQQRVGKLERHLASLLPHTKDGPYGRIVHALGGKQRALDIFQALSSGPGEGNRTYTPMREEPIIPTRERCAACQQPSIVSFKARDDIWHAVVHPQFVNSILCLACFASRADEKLIPWEEGIELFPVSLAAAHASGADPAGDRAMKSTHWSEAVKQAEAEGYARGLAQGRQEGFAETRERAAALCNQKAINWERRSAGCTNVASIISAKDKQISFEEARDDIRALQPKGGGNNG